MPQIPSTVMEEMGDELLIVRIAPVVEAVVVTRTFLILLRAPPSAYQIMVTVEMAA